jgi:outer membrane protein assembly factor BamE (lipoprotein component of BamABCDE complex)
MKRELIFLFCALFMLGGCHYTIRSHEGAKISAAQVQEIKLGKTTETDLLSLLGPPSKKEVKMDGSSVLLYLYSQTETPTLPGGFILYGFLEKDREEVFEITMRNGVVQSFHFIKP